ncbi:hypothetical protein [Bacilliculturomica massiliensis]|uniref:hypothetical protein n=1 Tax=Bacilliculturomica massiliensis TaxID=1917867 RepID=UPI0010316BA9|nr:hypothetical protein [Bacilliculturomica massiliensis]
MVTELEKLKRAKLYLDRLARGADPISGAELPGDTALNQERLARCFDYVSGILEQVIQNGGVVGKPPKQEALPPFTITEEQLDRLQYSEEPVGISRFAGRINELIDQSAVQKIKVTAFTKWLLREGYLREEIAEEGQKRRVPTEKGGMIGMSTQEYDGQGRKYQMVVYDLGAQKYLAGCLKEIQACGREGADGENIGQGGDGAHGEDALLRMADATETEMPTE